MRPLPDVSPAVDPYRWTGDMAARPAQRSHFRPRSGRARLAAAFGSWLGLGLAAGLALVVAVPYLFHGRALTVMSGSMEPALSTGDVIVAQRISPLDARVGDVITFQRSDGSGVLMTHRVRRVKVSHGYAAFVTKGDANNDAERWEIRTDGTIGRVKYRIPHLGYALFYMHTLWGRILFVLLPGAMLAGWAVRRIWR